ncbi:MAG TPA: type II glyceraldehyde-3-phosphate dehydrogenase [Chloroflexota bacterium]|nr:type II glyceraldehyde-3-phosphate dehydrogenase [Chloroflexota bacterium]
MANNQKVRVAVNGYGVIGKRVADAVACQDDMELAGVSDIVFDYRIRVAAERGYQIYASAPDKRPIMEQAGIPVIGTLDDLLRQADVVVDCTPKGIGAKNKPVYEQAGVKAIFQGGEKHELTGFSFTAQVNYGEALNRRYTRVVSCNTTALCRMMHAFQKRGWIKRARAVLMRRATDPWESHKNGMINTAVPETKVPSHQGPDAQTVLKGLDITTMAGAGPYNLSHLHYAMVETTRPVSLDDLRHALWEEPRIAFVRWSNGLVALNSVIELMRDLLRPRHDMWEVAVWEDALASDGRELYLTYQVDNEAIAIPENVDAIRAMCGTETDGARSIEKTNRSLGIVKSFFPKTIPEEAVHAEMGKALAVAEREFMAEGFKGAEEPAQPVPTTAQRG